MCVCAHALIHSPIVFQEGYSLSQLILLRGERVWGTGVGETRKGEGTHYNLPTLHPAGTALHENL